VLKALIFDVDGTLAETEELHRASFNHVFEQFGLDWQWSHEAYGKLLTTTGGKERIARFVQELGLPPFEASRIAKMHAAKNARYAEAVATGALRLRPGIVPLIRDAIKHGLKLGIATTTSRSNLSALLENCLSKPERDHLTAIICGEDVGRKKPDPEVYLLCLAKLNLGAAEAIAFEDSAVGLAAARTAQIATIITPSAYTKGDDFSGALAVLPEVPDCLDRLDAVTAKNGGSLFHERQLQ